MAGITQEQAQTQLDTYLAAEVAVLANQSYKIGNREYRRADLDAIQAGIKIWNDRLIDLSNKSSGRGRRRVIVARG